MTQHQAQTQIGRNGFGDLLFLVLLTLKLTGNIGWSWWWVTAPLWGGFALVFLFSFLVVIIAAASVGGRR